MYFTNIFRGQFTVYLLNSINRSVLQVNELEHCTTSMPVNSNF